MRLDLWLVQHGLAPTRTRAANLIKLGGVTVNGKEVCKASYDVDDQAEVQVQDVIAYASLGGLKLQEALQRFDLHPQGRCVDIGASNGGFTHCLLRSGAAKVYAVDVGACALPDWLCQDERVVVMDNTNARNLTSDSVGGAVDTVVADVSFISITLLLPVVAQLLKPSGWAVVLVKPQFEVGPRYLGKSGIVKDAKARQKALENVKNSAFVCGLTVDGQCEVPRLFEDKNIEYLLLLRKKQA